MKFNFVQGSGFRRTTESCWTTLARVARLLPALAWAAGFAVVVTTAELRPALEHAAAGAVLVYRKVTCEVNAKYESHVDSFMLASAATAKSTEAAAIIAASLTEFTEAVTCTRRITVATLARCATVTIVLAMCLVWLLDMIKAERALCARSLPPQGGPASNGTCAHY